MILTAALVFEVTAAGAGISWTRDHVQAFREAEERRAPVLVVFQGSDCGRRSAPGEIDRGLPAHDTALTDCERMQQDVWDSPRITEASARFIAVLADGGDRTLQTRYQVIVNPSALLLDPWGNEVFRVSGYLEPQKMVRVLEALPTDFAGLTPHGKALQKDARDLRALMGAAAFYEGVGLRQVSERLYDQAAHAPSGTGDPAVRREAAIARGLNLLFMKRAAEAAKVFEAAVAEAPQATGTDILLLGLVNAHLTLGKKRDAEQVYARLSRDFADSPYTRKARQNIDGFRP